MSRTSIARISTFVTLLAVVAVFLAQNMIAQAAPLTWTGGTGDWDTTTSNWDNGGPTTYTDGGVDDVTFDGTSPGTVTIQTGGVTGLSMTHSGGTHEFTGGALGDTLTTTPITLSGGVLQYDGLNRLGTGAISVTGSSTIEATNASSAQTGMSNSGIALTAGVTLSLEQNNPGSLPSGTIAPITGGGASTKIILNAAGGTNAYSLSTGSTFVGDIDLVGRIYFPTLSSDMFGDLGNTINGTLEARLGVGGGTVGQDINLTAGNSHWSGGASNPLILTGSVTTGGGELTGGTIRFTQAGNSLGNWSTNQGYTLEFAHDGDIGFNNLSSNGPDNGGNGFQGKTIRWVGAGLNGSASTNWTLASYGAGGTFLTGNIDVVDATSTVNWTGDWRTNTTNSTQQFEKEGAGTLNWSGTSTGAEPTVINVNGGRLNITSTTGNLGAVTVNSGATLGGTGSITPASVTVSSGATLAPGMSVGVFTVSDADVTFDSGAIYDLEIDSLTGTAGVDWDLLTLSGSSGDVILSGNLTLNITQAVAESFTGLRFLEVTSGGSITGFNPANFSFVSNLEGEYFIAQVGQTLELSFEVAVPEPSSFLLLGLGGLALVRNTRRRRRRV